MSFPREIVTLSLALSAQGYYWHVNFKYVGVMADASKPGIRGKLLLNCVLLTTNFNMITDRCFLRRS